MQDGIITLLAGLVLLLGGGSVLVPATVALAERLGLSARLIAFVIVAGGTSAPELTVSVDAALQGSPGIVWGNILGSNIANSLLVLGMGALVAPLVADDKITRFDLWALMTVSAFVCIALYFEIFSGSGGRMAGVCLVAGYGLYIYWLMRAQASMPAPQAAVQTRMPLYRSAALSLGGIAALVWGADLFVSGGVVLARHIGWSEAFIGITIIAIGTSLPEIISVAASLFHRRTDIALGNVLGSNLFNLLVALGGAAIAGPLITPVGPVIFPAAVIIAVTAVLLGFSLLRQPLGFRTGFVFIAFYTGFLLVQTYAYST